MTIESSVCRIVEELLAGSNVALLGGPGVGKSAQLAAATNLLEEMHVEITRVDLQSCRSGANALAAAIGLPSCVPEEDVVALWARLLAGIDATRRHVFVFDEFDAVADFDDGTFFIRSLREHFQFGARTGISMAIASRRPLRLIEESVTGVSTLDSVFAPHHPGLLNECDVSFLWPAIESSSAQCQELLEWSGGVRTLAHRYYTSIIVGQSRIADIEYERVLWAQQMAKYCERIGLGDALYQYVLGPVTRERPLERARLLSMSIIGDPARTLVGTDRFLWSYPTFVAEVRSRSDELRPWGERGRLELEARRLVGEVLRSTGLEDWELRSLGGLNIGWATSIERGISTPSLRDMIDSLPEGGLWTVLDEVWECSRLRLEPDDRDYWRGQFCDLGGIGQMRSEKRAVDEAECAERASLLRTQRESKRGPRPRSRDLDSVPIASTTYNVSGNAIVSEARGHGRVSVDNSANSSSRREDEISSRRRKSWWLISISVGGSLATIAGLAWQIWWAR